LLIFLTEGDIDNNNGFTTIELPKTYNFYDVNKNKMVSSNNIILSASGYFSYYLIDTLSYQYFGNIPDNSILFFYAQIYNIESYYKFISDDELMISIYGGFIDDENNSFKLIIDIKSDGIIKCHFKAISNEI
jgi:hypothetical protein